MNKKKGKPYSDILIFFLFTVFKKKGARVFNRNERNVAQWVFSEIRAIPRLPHSIDCKISGFDIYTLTGQKIDLWVF